MATSGRKQRKQSLPLGSYTKDDFRKMKKRATELDVRNETVFLNIANLWQEYRRIVAEREQARMAMNQLDDIELQREQFLVAVVLGGELERLETFLLVDEGIHYLDAIAHVIEPSDSELLFLQELKWLHVHSGDELSEGIYEVAFNSPHELHEHCTRLLSPSRILNSPLFQLDRDILAQNLPGIAPEICDDLYCSILNSSTSGCIPTLLDEFLARDGMQTRDCKEWADASGLITNLNPLVAREFRITIAKLTEHGLPVDSTLDALISRGATCDLDVAIRLCRGARNFVSFTSDEAAMPEANGS
jgi:hypothetical protein